jgi:hypothetical protein
VNFFLDLVETGKIRTKEELRSLYRQVIKTYHPDSRPIKEKAVDFDDLKRGYLEAADRLAEMAASGPGAAPAGEPFRYEAEAYMNELRDLVARGLPVSEKAIKKNKAYAASMEYVAKCVEKLYGPAYGFAQLNEQMRFLYRRIPRVYYYALQVLWSAYDCASGYAYAKTIAERHLGCIAYTLKEMGYTALERFLSDVIDISTKVGAAAGIARGDGA